MRIVCLSNMYPGPGAPDYGAFVADMCGALEGLGHRVTPVVIDSRASGALRTPAKYAGLLARALRRGRGADVLYAHYLFPTGAIAAAAARVARVPWVVTAHGGDVANLTRAPVLRATAAAVHSAAAVIAVSEYLAQRIRDAGLHPAALHVANMGVDTARFVPADRVEARGRLGIDPAGELVLAVGGLTARKDPLNLLQAFARLRAARPGLRLALVGDGPLAGAVDSGMARLGLPAGSVIRPGALPHDRVADWMTAADVLSMVSRVEPLGVVALEALASGRPVVATAEGGAREVVPARGPGAIVTPGDPVALAAALEAMLASPPDPADCRAAAAGSSLDVQAARVADILEAAAGDGAAATLTRR